MRRNINRILVFFAVFFIGFGLASTFVSLHGAFKSPGGFGGAMGSTGTLGHNSPNVFDLPSQAARKALRYAPCDHNKSWPQFEAACLDVVNLKRVLPSLTDGQFIYNRITKLWRGAPETVVLKLNLASEAAPVLPPALSGESITGFAKVTPEMSVVLKGTAGLTVKPLGEARQRISDLSPTVWQWTVTGTKTNGAEILLLTVFIHVDDGAPFTLKTFEDEIQVNITDWQWIKGIASEMKPIWAFLIGAIPICWAAYVWLRNRRWKPPTKKWVSLSTQIRSKKSKKNIPRG
ncbi:hypothetical protein EBB79_08300 [Parasedimentitalea marina]|uniref:Uncharacterized protein n=1 Tax=Parasedimentitalea marina TaxID=2483033 RepID=A0A3T0N1K3_9RHOB|nr:hypothetical protein [Parasedimentitalea marina]AZV77896.1 hypothetical protein EBB79_08300 [Parasedimentitalea marina]